MSEEAKRMLGGGALLPKSLSDDRKSSSDDRKSMSGSSLTTAAGKKFIIKSADMKEDMQKEAIDIAISVTILFLSLIHPFYFILIFPHNKGYVSKKCTKDFIFRDFSKWVVVIREIPAGF